MNDFERNYEKDKRNHDKFRKISERIETENKEILLLEQEHYAGEMDNRDEINQNKQYRTELHTLRRIAKEKL